MPQEIIDLIVTIAPSIGGIIGIVVSILLSIRKITTMINEFRQSNELKKNNEQIEALLKDNENLKKMNEKILVELTRIKPKGWCDDDQQVH